MPEHGHKPTTCDSFVAMEERGAREAYGSVSTLQVLAVLCTQDYGGRRATIRVHPAKKCQDPPCSLRHGFLAPQTSGRFPRTSVPRCAEFLRPPVTGSEDGSSRLTSQSLADLARQQAGGVLLLPATCLLHHRPWPGSSSRGSPTTVATSARTFSLPMMTRMAFMSSLQGL